MSKNNIWNVDDKKYHETDIRKYLFNTEIIMHTFIKNILYNYDQLLLPTYIYLLFSYYVKKEYLHEISTLEHQQHDVTQPMFPSKQAEYILYEYNESPNLYTAMTTQQFHNIADIDVVCMFN